MAEDTLAGVAGIPAPIAAALAAAREAIRRQDLAALHELRAMAGAANPLAIQLSYLLTLTIDVWKHPGRLPVLVAFASSARPLAAAAGDLVDLLQQHVFGGRDTSYVGGNCNRPRPAEP